MYGVEHATPGIILLMLAFVSLVLFYIRRARQSKTQLYIRRIAGVDAVDEAVGRAAELGRPISFTTALTNVGPALYACLGVLYYIANKSAKYRTPLYLPQSDPEVMPITEEVLRDAYRAAGRFSQFDPKSVVFLAQEQFAFAAGYMGLIHREKVASCFLMGTFAAESLILAEAGQQVGAMQVAASISPEQVSFFICTCDYTLIGEELFGASAYLTREPIQLGSLYGQDRAKLMFLLMIAVDVLISTYNSLSVFILSAQTQIPTFSSWLLRENW